MHTKLIPLLILVTLFIPLGIKAQEEVSEGEPPIEQEPAQTKRVTYKAEVVSAEDIACEDEAMSEAETKSCIKVDVKILEGEIAGEIKSVVMDTRSDVLAKKWELEKGKKVVVTEFAFGEFSDYQITEIYRANSIIWFVLLYVVLVLIVGGFQGLGSLIGLGLSVLVLLKIVIPMTLNGWDPILVSIFGGLCVLLPSIYFSHGINIKTTIALFGTIFGLLATGLLAAISLEAVSLTGLGGEESLFLISGSSGELNMQSILLASMIIGGIGLIDDVTVGQVAVIKEIFEENPKITLSKLYKKSMNVGRDHIASMVNTLFLAYAAASLPLVMLLVDQGAKLNDIVNIETFAEEIVRTLVASTGLVLTVPITTFIAAYLYVHRDIIEKKYREMTV